MIFDLAATFAEGGTHDALRQLVVESIGVAGLPPTARTIELLDALRREDILSQIPQPQDRLLPDSEIERIKGAVVIAEENQVLWFATLDRRSGQPTVTFFAQPNEGRRPGVECHRLGSLDLDRFLLGALVANAVDSGGASRFRAEIEPATEIANAVVSAVNPIAPHASIPFCASSSATPRSILLAGS